MKKILLIGLLPILFLLIILFFFLFNIKKITTRPKLFLPTPTPIRYNYYNSSTNSTPSNSNPTNSQNQNLGATITETQTNQAEGKVKVDGIYVKNFFISPIESNDQGDVLIVNDTDFQISFLNPFQSFLITILGSPFDQVRQKAELQFLQILGITQEEACKLPVTVNTPHFANPDKSGIDYKLSFCS